MNTIIIVNKKHNLIDSTQMDNFVDKLESLNVSVSKVVLTNYFDADIKTLNLEECDFVVVFNTSSIKLNKKLFLIDNYTKIDEYIAEIAGFVSAQSKNSVLIKTFGLTESQIRSKISNVTNNGVKIDIYSNVLDCKIILNFERVIEQNVVSNVFETLKNNIYTNDNFSIYEIACNLLSISNKTCAVVETITKGNIANNLMQVDFANNIKFGLTGAKLDNFATQLNINPDSTNYNSEVELVYEIAASVLDTHNTDYVVLTYGSIENNYCHIAIGDVDGIHIYKNKFSANNSQLIDTLSKSAIFYLIKKIKQNDLFFNQIIV